MLAMVKAKFYTLQDGNEPVVPKGGKSGSGGKGAAAAGTDVQLDTEWIAEHAASVTRMLPGGGGIGTAPHPGCSRAASRLRSSLKELCPRAHLGSQPSLQIC